jgi:hypothetical protein
MSPRRLVAAAIVALALAAVLAAPAAADVADVAVTTDRAGVETQLGRDFHFRTTVTNDGATGTEPLVAHLNILSLTSSVYVDPEDWSTQRTQYLGSIPAGGERTITWNIKAVNDGDFAAYATILSQNDPAGTAPATGDAVRVAVAKRTTLNSGGIVPLALGIPGALAALAVAARLSRRRVTSPGR